MTFFLSLTPVEGLSSCKMFYFASSQLDYGASEMDTMPHYDQGMWLFNCQRPQAENLLAGKPDGTFLIRPKSEEGNVHVLSIV